MSNSTLAQDFLIKCANLCSYLKDQKSETLLSDKLFLSASSLGEYCHLLSSSSMGKQEISSYRKEAFVCWQKTVFYLECVYMSSLISEAQKDSMMQTLTILKKETNI